MEPSALMACSSLLVRCIDDVVDKTLGATPLPQQVVSVSCLLLLMWLTTADTVSDSCHINVQLTLLTVTDHGLTIDTRLYVPRPMANNSTTTVATSLANSVPFPVPNCVYVADCWAYCFYQCYLQYLLYWCGPSNDRRTPQTATGHYF